MQINIQARSFSLTRALKNHTENKLKSSLSRCEDHLQHVVIKLSDVNGPRGGEDKRCHLQVMLFGLPDVIIEDTEEDMYVAIDRATDRAKSVVAHKIKRQQTLLKHKRQTISHLMVRQ